MMRIRGPIVTLGAVAALAAGFLVVNVSKQGDSPPANPYPKSTTTTAAATPAAPPPASSTPPPPAFPAKADYVGKIPIAGGVITLEISIASGRAVGYACDGNTIESWLRGYALNGGLSLANKDKSSRLEGRLEGSSVAGTLWIGGQTWGFVADPAQPPAGLYMSGEQNAGVRTSWIVDANGGVTGVQRRPDGSTGPAPAMSANGTAVIDGQTITATRVQGDSDV